MSFTPPVGYYNRFDPADNYEEHLFRAGKTLQSAEVNEIQRNAAYRLKGVADALFRDGNLIRDGRIVVNASTGLVQCEAGAVYVSGVVRSVPAASFTIPIVGTVVIGVRLTDTVITEIEDADLKDPAVGLRNYREPGAYRLRTAATWGWDGDLGSPIYPVYWVDDGVLRAKEPPPTVDAFAFSLAKYDRDSAGGTYVIEGFGVTQLPDVTLPGFPDLTGLQQVYTVREGRARCYGWPIEQPTSRRVVFAAVPTTHHAAAEAAAVTGTSPNWSVKPAHIPIKAVQNLAVMREKTVTITHGPTRGGTDLLPDTPMSVVWVKQAAYTFTPTTHYLAAGGQNFIDWSPGADLPGGDGTEEPAPGSTYTVRYQYYHNSVPTSGDVTQKAITVAENVNDGGNTATLVSASPSILTYDYYVPRIDRLCLNQDGAIVWLKGTPSDWTVYPPDVPTNLLPIAQVYQTWDERRMLIPDGARMVPMPTLFAIQGKLDRVLALIAMERLQNNAAARDASLKKSLFADPFTGDDLRDQGLTQTGAIADETLQLGHDMQAAYFPTNIAPAASLVQTRAPVLEQPLRTGWMLINPYLAFDPAPAEMTLTPSIDQWQETVTEWASPVTRNVIEGHPEGIWDDATGTFRDASGRELPGLRIVRTTNTIEQQELVAMEAAYLRTIPVQFYIAGFGPGETLASFTFDGVVLTPTAI